MKKLYYLAILFLFSTSCVFADSQYPRILDPAKEKEIKTRIGNLQIPFIKNESQIKDKRVKYYAHTFAGTVFVTDNEIVYGLKGWAVKESFLNTKKTKAEGINLAETKVSYFKGSNSKNWIINIPTFNEISLGEVYKNITLKLKAYGRNVEKMFIIETGGNPEEIAVKVEGAKGLKVNKHSELEIETGIGRVKMTKPVAYQVIEGQKVLISCQYCKKSNLAYGFKVKGYNRCYPLIIDPFFASTFLGGFF